MNQWAWIGVAVAGTVGAAWLAVRAVRWAKKGTAGAKVLTGALFPFPDQPPPHEQIEQQIRLKKDAQAGDADD
jgi:hypothetical protein